MIRSIFRIVFLIVIFQACTPKNANDQMNFQVDPSLLAEYPYLATKDGMGLYPPKEWKWHDTTSSLFKQLQVANKANIMALYSPEAEDAMLMINETQGMDASLLLEIVGNPAAYYNQDSIWNAVMHDRFQYKEFDINQIILQNDQLVIFKLFVQFNSKLMELNYMLPSDASPQTMKSVESSIGSIYSITN
jgi:hypothetical protein